MYKFRANEQKYLICNRCRYLCIKEYLYCKYVCNNNEHICMRKSNFRNSLLHRLLPAVFHKLIFEFKDICATNYIAQSKNKQICYMGATAIYLTIQPSLRFNSNLNFLVSFYRITYGWRANFEVTCGVEELFGSEKQKLYTWYDP